MRILLGVLIICLPLVLLFLWLVNEEDIKEALIIFSLALTYFLFIAACTTLGIVILGNI